MKKQDPDPDMEENLARCLAARRSLERQFRTPKEWSDFLFRLEEERLPPPPAKEKRIRARAHPFQELQTTQRGVRTGKAQARKKGLNAVKNGRPAIRQASHKR